MIAFLQVNPVRSKELSNMRSAGKDENVKLSPPRLVCIFQSWFLTFWFLFVCSGNEYACNA